MELVDVNTIGFAPLALDILTPDTHLARIMLYQCEGNIEAVPQEYVRNENRNDAENKHREFLHKAQESQASAAITPEYSTPWSVIEYMAQTPNIQPPLGSLWVLGCESITYDELEELKQRATLFTWHYEDLTPRRNQVFYSPVTYIYHLKDSTQDAPKIAALVQFKSREMGGTVFERDALIRGEKRYLIHNDTQPDSIKLLTIVCADAFDFKVEDLDPYTPYLLIHIQLNTAPYQDGFMKYRSDIYNPPKKTLVEIVSLNWAAGTFLAGKAIDEHNGSAYYLQPENKTEPCLDETVINENHTRGVYLRFSTQQQFSTYVFNPKIPVFFINATKVAIRGPATHLKRTGINFSETMKWGNEEERWINADFVDDGIQTGLMEHIDCAKMSPMNREKLLALSTGDIDESLVRGAIEKGIPKDATTSLLPYYWVKPRAMKSFYLNNDHKPKGMLAILDAAQTNDMSTSLAKVSELNSKITSNTALTEVLEDFVDGQPVIKLCEHELKDGYVSTNIIDEKSGAKAAVVELGHQCPDNAQRKFDEIKRVTNSRRLVVFYRYKGADRVINDNIASIDDGPSGPDDFSREN